MASISSLRTAHYSHPIISDTQDSTLFLTDTILFALFVSTLDGFLLFLPTTRSSSTNPEPMLILTIHFLRFILACPTICSRKGNQSGNEVIAHFLSLSRCLVSCTIPPVELNPHLQFQPFFLLLLTHSSNLFSCIPFFLHNRMQIFIPRESQKT